jgi:hypothetical protein
VDDFGNIKFICSDDDGTVKNAQEKISVA